MIKFHVWFNTNGANNYLDCENSVEVKLLWMPAVDQDCSQNS